MELGHSRRVSHPPVERRLRIAVDASVGWYEDLFALHGVPSTMRDGLWSGLGPPPPLHSDALVVEPSVTASQVAARLEGRPHAGFKDSFSSVDGAVLGMDLLFEAEWIHRAALDGGPAEMPDSWSVVVSRAELAEWTSGHDTADVLLPGLLDRAHFRILAKHDAGRIVAGAIARLGSGAVDVSNVHADPGHRVDWAELATVVAAHFPGRPLVGYERGDELAAALDGRWDRVGTLRVWVR
jgi:hypothetical protein